jgi:hypothetical protein
MDSVLCIGFDAADLAKTERKARALMGQSACAKHNELNREKAEREIAEVEKNLKGTRRCD